MIFISEQLLGESIYSQMRPWPFQGTTNRPFWDCDINVSHPSIVILLLIIYIWPEFTEILDTRKITNHEFYWKDRELTEYNVFVDSFRIYIVISWINFKFIFSSGLEILSTFNIHHLVYGCLIVLFNLTKSTIVNHPFGRSSTSSCQTPSI